MLNDLPFRTTLASLLLAALASAAAFIPTDVPATEPNPRVQELQEGLAELGYDPGPADGLVGPKTQEAIIAFQEDHDLTVDGQYSGLLLFHVNTQLRVATHATTPEGRLENEKRERLLALSDGDLITFLEQSSQDEAEAIINLIGQRAADLPLYLLFRKLGIAGSVDSMVSLVLRGLYYPDSIEGIKQFQSDIGNAETGELHFGEFNEMHRRWTRTRDTPVYVGGRAKITVVGGHASVEGTWILEGEQIAFPVNHGKISCDRARGVCDLVQAEVMVPPIEKDDDSYQLNVDLDTYDTITWDANEIVARDASLCRTSLLTLNISSNEVYEVTRNNETKACREGYLTLPPLEKPRIARLVPGFNATYDFWQNRRTTTSKYLNPRVRTELEAAPNRHAE